ncbi:hypothetical protein T440DRAFT_513973 [Plenodomus tracheiphilus IPT5]|uniref:Uncharacterized protein n=1 Tax=Plenodomus tracheiphilus IPT5 TaxID=1408161 RepID=A0A6A7BP15_9PLEO|nr:hypothetical protein T440DRAFT_513973 [Plenodomus tracheiphilus IPT5]
MSGEFSSGVKGVGHETGIDDGRRSTTMCFDSNEDAASYSMRDPGSYASEIIDIEQADVDSDQQKVMEDSPSQLDATYTTAEIHLYLKDDDIHTKQADHDKVREELADLSTSDDDYASYTAEIPTSLLSLDIDVDHVGSDKIWENDTSTLFLNRTDNQSVTSSEKSTIILDDVAI